MQHCFDRKKLVAEWIEILGIEVLMVRSLQEEIGELADADERRFRTLRMAKEKQLLGAADVICCTCVSAADNRLSHMRIK